jgi:hypothetical protein
VALAFHGPCAALLTEIIARIASPSSQRLISDSAARQARARQPEPRPRHSHQAHARGGRDGDQDGQGNLDEDQCGGSWIGQRDIKDNAGSDGFAIHSDTWRALDDDATAKRQRD